MLSKILAAMMVVIIVGCAEQSMTPPTDEELFAEQLVGKWYRSWREFDITRLFKNDRTYYYRSEKRDTLIYFERGTWAIIGPRLNYGYRVVFTIWDASIMKSKGESYSLLATIRETKGHKELHLASMTGRETTYYSRKDLDVELPSLLEKPVGANWAPREGQE